MIIITLKTVKKMLLKNKKEPINTNIVKNIIHFNYFWLSISFRVLLNIYFSYY
jgi:hypothetical protein